MINIVLNKIHIQPIDIVDALEQYNLAILTPNICELIAPIMPLPKEVEALTTAQFENEDDLTTADQFILIMANFVAGFERAKSVLFSFTYEEDAKVLMEEAEKFFVFFDFLKKDEGFKEFLTQILAFGNYMNGGNARGGAYGFNLEFLAHLADTKTTDNKKTFIKYLFEVFIDKLNKKDLLTKLIENVTVGDKLQFIGLLEGVSAMEKKFHDVEMLKKKVEQKKADLMEGDKSEEFLGKIYDKGAGYLKTLNGKIEAIQKEFDEIRKYYAEEIKKGQEYKETIPNFLGIFKTLKKDLVETMNWYEEMDEKRKKKKK
ncbi:MAG: FH2 domain-containing protein [archaeon]|nr:FH2 domain-containing protein [archaeon]